MLDARTPSALQPWRHKPLWGWGNLVFSVIRATTPCKHGISNACYYQWKSKFVGMSANDLKRTRDLEAENSKLKRMYAELALENAAIKDDVRG